MGIKAVIFDAYGTLFDVYSVARLAETLFPGQGAKLAELWRDKQIEYSRLRTLSGQYRPFSQVTQDSLVFSLRKLRLDDSSPIVQRLVDQYGRLEVFPENAGALAELCELGLPLAILSNGDLPMLEPLLAQSGLGPYFTALLSADQVRRFKTAPEVYQLGPDTLGHAAAQMLFVSSNAWDACGARWFGYQSFWINRAGQPPEELGIAPDATGSSMRDVVAHVRSHAAASPQPPSHSERKDNE